MAAKQQEVTGWSGWVAFASFMMILVGFFGIFEGLTAIFNSKFYVVTEKYLVTVNLTTWGWVHLLLSIVVIAAGYAVMQGKVWGRTVGVILAMLSALANMAFLPHYPLWSLLIITIDIFVIFALIVHGHEMAQ